MHTKFSRAFTVFLSVILMFLMVYSGSAEVPETVDYSSYSEEELLSVYDAVSGLLSGYGYRFEMNKPEDGSESANVANIKEEVVVPETPETNEEVYSRAVGNEEEGKFDEALALFAGLGDYLDSSEHVKRNVVNQAQLLFDEGEYKACQSILLNYPSEDTTELLQKCNDQCFLLDLASALSARWDNIGEDTSLMSDKKLIAYFSTLVNTELEYVSDYVGLEFYDKKLREYAQNYLGALQSQLIGITEYYGIDENLYNEYWMNSGYYKRAIAVYWINRKFGIEMPAKYKEDLSKFVLDGRYFDMWHTIENMLEKQLYAASYTISTTKNKNNVTFDSFTMENTSLYSIESLRISVNYLDTSGNKVGEGNIYSNYNGVNSGTQITTDSDNTYDHFSGILFSYEFRINDGRYSETYDGTITPRIQYAWDGKISKDGSLLNGQENLVIDGLTTQWDTRFSLYVPQLKFSVKNTGDADAETVIVKCIFINEDTKEIWDSDTTYVIGSSDAPLQPGFSKKVFSYASVGYESKLSSKQLPNLSVEIYINDELITTEKIRK